MGRRKKGSKPQGEREIPPYIAMLSDLLWEIAADACRDAPVQPQDRNEERRPSEPNDVSCDEL
jgi:hypothetical protein